MRRLRRRIRRGVHPGQQGRDPYASPGTSPRRSPSGARRKPHGGPGQAAELAAILARLPRVSREEIEACRTPAGGYSFTKAWFLEHGLPYPPIAGWRQAVERDEDGGDPGADEAQVDMTGETITVLKNYDYLIRRRGLDDVLLDWATNSLACGEVAVLITALVRPGFTPATEDGADDGSR